MKDGTSATRGLITGRRLRDAVLALKVQFKELYPIFWTGSAWPALSTAPADWIAAGGGIDWNSSDDIAATTPGEARNDIDYWTRKIA